MIGKWLPGLRQPPAAASEADRAGGNVFLEPDGYFRNILSFGGNSTINWWYFA